MQAYWFLTSLLVTVTHIVLLASTLTSGNVKKEYNLCTEKSCRDMASNISANLNRTVDPCDNFYDFACGGLIKNHPVHDSRQRTTQFDIQKSKVVHEIKDMLEDRKEPQETLSLQKARRLYAMCMDDEKKKFYSIDSLVKSMKRNDLWPLFLSSKEWMKKGFYSWQAVSNMLHKNWLRNGLYDIFVEVDKTYLKQRVIVIEVPPIPIKREEIINMAINPLNKEKYISDVRILVEKIWDYMYLSEKRVFEDNILQIVDFEIELAKMILKQGRGEIHLNYDAIAIETWQNIYDQQCNSFDCNINWKLVLSNLFASLNIPIFPFEMIQVRNYQYFTDLIPLLERTPFHIIADYMQWKFVENVLNFIYLDDMEKTTDHPLLRTQEPIDCVQDFNLFSAISYEYTKRIMPRGFLYQKEAEAFNYTTLEIRNVIRDQIVASRWMDGETKQMAESILNHMKIYVGAPSWFNDTYIDDYYNDLIITSDYIESVLNLFKFNRKKMLLGLRQRVNNVTSYVESGIIHKNGYYFEDERQHKFILMPAAVVREFIYSIDRLAPINYGLLGFLIAHEIHHLFYNKGYTYLAFGLSDTWMMQESIPKLSEMNECFMKQSNNHQIDGNKTFNENIADVGGITVAYMAYKRMKEKFKQPDLALYGLEEYSEDQIFFINFANMICKDLVLSEKQGNLNVHALHEARVRSSLSNLHEFSAAYNCAKGQRMNPEKKCSLW